MSRPLLVFVESNTSGTGWLFLRAAMECGYTPLLVAEKPEGYGFLQQDSITCLSWETGSVEKLCDGLERLSHTAPIAGIFSSSEYFIETAAVLAARFGLPGANAEAVKVCRNKWTQRRALQQMGVGVPLFEHVSSLDGARKALNSIPLPAVLKPTTGSGSVGVRLCRTEGEFLEHADLLLRRTSSERGIPVPPEFLVEEYIAGPEFSVEVFSGVVVGITRKHVSNEPFFVEVGHDFPAELSPEAVEEISEVARMVARDMGLAWGPIHIELRMAHNGPAIIEINPRLAGGFIPEIMRLAYGIDMIRQTVLLATGKKPQLGPASHRHSSIRFLVPSFSGAITHICGTDEAVRVPGVEQIQLYRKAGDRIQLENDFRDRIGHVISCGISETEAARGAELARDMIKIHLKN